MTEHFPIPDAQTRKLEVERLRATNQQLERFELELDELTAIVETDLLRQRRQRLEKRHKIEL